MVDEPVCEPIDEPVAVSGPSASSVVPRTLLSVLKPAAKSHLARKRVRKPPARKRASTSQCDLKNIKPEERVKEFPGEFLQVRRGKLFCSACREEISLKKSIIKNHTYSGNKHNNSKKKLAEREARERDIANYLKRIRTSCWIIDTYGGKGLSNSGSGCFFTCWYPSC